MPKHMKVRAELIDDKANVKVTILEMSHMGNKFSAIDKTGLEGRHTGCFAHKDAVLCALKSSSGIRIENAFWNMGELMLVMGTLSVGRSITLSLGSWAKIKAAIQAYNEWGATQ